MPSMQPVTLSAWSKRYQAVLKLTQWCWHISKRSIIAQCTGLELDQRYLVDCRLQVVVDAPAGTPLKALNEPVRASNNIS